MFSYHGFDLSLAMAPSAPRRVRKCISRSSGQQRSGMPTDGTECHHGSRGDVNLIL